MGKYFARTKVILLYTVCLAKGTVLHLPFLIAELEVKIRCTGHSKAGLYISCPLNSGKNFTTMSEQRFYQGDNGD